MSNMKRTVDTDWRQLCQIAFLEFDPVKTLARIDDAGRSVLTGIESSFTKSEEGEQSALREALSTLDALRRITEDQGSHPSKTAEVKMQYSWLESYQAAVLETERKWKSEFRLPKLKYTKDGSNKRSA
jgi:hypothetical protein